MNLNKPRTEQLLDEFLLLLEASQRANGVEHIRIHRSRCGNDMCLHHLHHRQLQLQLTFATSRDPGMAVDFSQLDMWIFGGRKNKAKTGF